MELQPRAEGAEAALPCLKSQLDAAGQNSRGELWSFLRDHITSRTLERLCSFWEAGLLSSAGVKLICAPSSGVLQWLNSPRVSSHLLRTSHTLPLSQQARLSRSPLSHLSNCPNAAGGGALLYLGVATKIDRGSLKLIKVMKAFRVAPPPPPPPLFSLLLARVSHSNSAQLRRVLPRTHAQKCSLTPVCE